MQSKEILEGNRLIGEFMGYRMFHKRYPRNHWIGAPEATWNDMIVEKSQFHASWDRLMAVVEKINTTIVPEDSRGDDVTYVVTIEPRYCVICAGGEETISEEQAFDSGEPLIDTVYRAVLKFIQWYNTQPHE